MDFYGNINLNNNEMQKMVMQVETNFPDTPVAGRVVFKDKRLYICVEIASGLPVWVPMTREIDTHVHVEDVAASTWTITHNLKTNTPLVQVYEASSGNLVIPDDITVVDINTVSVTFTSDLAGRAVAMGGSVTGTEKPTVAYEHLQTSASTSWVVTHGLGYEPIVRVFVGNQEVQPATIVHDTLNQTTITFSSPLAGFARFI